MPLPNRAFLSADAGFNSVTRSLYGVMAGFTAGSIFEIGEVFIKDVSCIESCAESTLDIMLASLLGGILFKATPIAFRYLSIRLRAAVPL